MDQKIEWNETGNGWLWETELPGGGVAVGRAPTKAQAEVLIAEARTPKREFRWRSARSRWALVAE